MRRIYQAYCRACSQASCSPWAVIPALLIVGTVLAVSSIRAHEHGVIHGLAVLAAAALTVTSAGLAIRAMRIVAAAAGQHADPATIPVQAPVPVRPVPVPEPARAPQRQGEPRYSYTLGKPYTEAMAAEADALRDDLITPVATQDGELMEIRDGKLPWPVGRQVRREP